MEGWERAAYRAVFPWLGHPLYDDLHNAARFAAWRVRDADPRLMFAAAKREAIDEVRNVLGRPVHHRTGRPSNRWLLSQATSPRDPHALEDVAVAHVDEDPYPCSEQLGLSGRDALLVEWLLEGRPYAWMAERFGVSVSRVTQMFREMSERVDRADLAA